MARPKTGKTHKELCATWNANNVEYRRNWWYQRTYGISLQEFEEMVKVQGGLCKICGEPPIKGRALHVDHDHKTGKVRGLLCFRCNGALGWFEAHEQEITNYRQSLT